MQSFDKSDQQFAKLNQHTTAVSGDLFEKIIQKRTKQPLLNKFDNLSQYSIPVSDGLFDKIMQKRQNRAFYYLNNKYTHRAAILLLLLFAFYTGNNIVNKTPNPNNNNTTIAAIPVITNEISNSVDSKKSAALPITETKKVIVSKPASSKLNTFNLSNDIINPIVAQPTDIEENLLLNTVDQKAVENNIDKTQVTVNNEPTNLGSEPNILGSENKPTKRLAILDKLNNRQRLIDYQYTPNLKLGNNDKCPTFGKNTDKTWYVDAWVSPDYALRSLQSRSTNAESTELATLRNNNEKFQFAASGGIKASLVFKSGVSLRLGAMYSQIWEYFDYKNPAESRVTRDTTLVEISPGNYDIKISVRTLTGERIVKYNNYYKLYDIPLQVGYEFGRDKDLRYSANIGMNINISASYRGKTLDENLKPIEFTTGKTSSVNEVYQNSVGLSFYGSFAVYKRINYRWQFVVEPNVRYMLGSLTKDTYELSHRYTTFGVNLGVRYRIN